MATSSSIDSGVDALTAPIMSSSPLFTCQRCLQPLHLQPDLLVDPGEHVQAELRLPLGPVDDEHEEQETVDNNDVDEVIPPTRSFTLLDVTNKSRRMSSSSNSSKPLISAGVSRVAELFDVLSRNGGQVDHPMCEECTDALLETLDTQLKQAEEEAQEYKAFLRELEQESESDSQVSLLERQLSELENDEARLTSELEALKLEQSSQSEELQRQHQIRDKLEEEEQRYWREYSRHQRQLLLAEDEYRSLDCTLKYTQSQLDRLKKLNAFNACFQIWHSGHFATINGFRMGRLPAVPIEWSEINAAWGQAALLLVSMANAMDIEHFQRYQVVPLGNFSYVRVLSDNKQLPLYGSRGLRMLFDTKFDSAMVAFLDCLQQLAAVVEREGNFSLPYEMDKGKIRDSNTGQYYAIKQQFNSEESWTKALRYMLTNMKWALAFVSTKYVHGNNKS